MTWINLWADTFSLTMVSLWVQPCFKSTKCGLKLVWFNVVFLRFCELYFSASWLLKFWNQDCIKPLEEAKRKENTNHRRQKGRKLSKSLDLTSHCQQWLSLMLFVNYKTTSLNDISEGQSVCKLKYSWLLINSISSYGKSTVVAKQR